MFHHNAIYQVLSSSLISIFMASSSLMNALSSWFLLVCSIYFAEICSCINLVVDLEFVFTFYWHSESYATFLGLGEVMV